MERTGAYSQRACKNISTAIDSRANDMGNSTPLLYASDLA
jgi:hypothetical protein